MPSNKSDFRFDLDHLPALLREGDICRSAEHEGLLPLSRSTWRDLIEDGYVPKGIKLGSKIVAWPREIVISLVRNGTGDRRARGRRAKARAKARTKALADIEDHERSQRALTNEGEAAKAAAPRKLKAAAGKGEATRPADTPP